MSTSEDPLVEHGDGLQDAEVDQAGFLDPRDDLDVDAGLLPRPVEELVGVHRLADGAGGDGPHGRPEAGGDLAHPPEGGDAAVDGVRRQHLHVAAAVAQADDLLLARQGLEPIGPDRAGDEEVEAVRADIERGQCLLDAGPSTTDTVPERS